MIGCGSVPCSGQVLHVASGDADLYVEVSGTGAPLVLVHGWPLDRRIFAPQVPELERHFTVINFDRRGFGRSTGRPDLRRELDDFDRVIDACARDPVHLLGMSQGARLALRYAVTRTSRLRSMVLQGAVVEGLSVAESERERIPVADYAEMVRQGRLDEFRRRWLQHPMMHIPAQAEDAAALLREILADYRGADLEVYAPELYGFPMDISAAMHTLVLPTLLLTGAHETDARKAHAARILQSIRGAREITLERSGHLGNLTEPETYNRAVIDFCGGVDQRAESEPGALD